MGNRDGNMGRGKGSRDWKGVGLGSFTTSTERPLIQSRLSFHHGRLSWRVEETPGA